MENRDLVDLQSFQHSSSLFPPMNNDEDINAKIDNIFTTDYESLPTNNHRLSNLNEKNHFSSPLTQSLDYYLKDPYNVQPIHFSELPHHSQHEFHFIPNECEILHDNEEQSMNEEYSDDYISMEEKKSQKEEISSDDESDGIVPNDSEPINTTRDEDDKPTHHSRSLRPKRKSTEMKTSLSPKKKPHICRKWTVEEEQALIEMAEQLVQKDMFTLRNLAKQYSELHTERSYDGALNTAKKLDRQGKIKMDSRKRFKKPDSWTEEEQQQLIKLAEKMINDGQFSFHKLGKLYSEQHGGRTAEAAKKYARIFFEAKVPADSKKLTEVENNLIRHIAEQMIEEKSFSFKNLAGLFSQQTGISHNVSYEHAKQFILQGDVVSMRERDWTKVEIQQLIQLVDSITKKGPVSYYKLGKIYSRMYPQRSAHASSEYAIKLAKMGLIQNPNALNE